MPEPPVTRATAPTGDRSALFAAIRGGTALWHLQRPFDRVT